MNEQVAKNLKRFREMLGWTQEHLAEAAGLSARTIQRAERDGELSAETMQALAAVFDISVADLQRIWPTDEEVRAAIEEAAKRYKQIPLTRLERASTCVHSWERTLGRSTTLLDCRSNRRMRSPSWRNC